MLSACVGKIEEASVPVNSQFQPEAVYFDYRGIETALPIANDKVELSFARAVGDTNDIVYKLYINDSNDPITLGLETLSTHFSGRYYYIVKGLNINTLYSFKIRAFKISEGAESKSENTKQARTYNNTVADFSGVGNLALVAGLEDKAIKVSWDRVPYIFGLIPSKKDPMKYEVIYSSVSPDELFNPGSTYRTVVEVNTDLPSNHPASTIISNLLSNKTYYFAVRAIHRGYQEYLSQGAAYIPIDRERNTKFLSLKTSETLTWTLNDDKKSELQNAKGESGYKDISVSWDKAKGSYAGYKVLYRRFDEYDGTTQSLSLFDINKDVIQAVITSGTTNPAKQGIITCLNQTNPCPGGNTQVQIKNLTPGAWYHVQVFVCELTDTSCPIIKDDNTLFKSFNKKSIRVKPSLSSFMGISSIQNPSSDLADDEVTLEFSPPDTTNGWADTMNFYCVDRLNPDSGTNQILIGTTPLINAGSCTGIYRASFSNTSISTMKNLSVRGAILGQDYTFSASPEYNQSPFNGANAVTYPPLERTKRNILPEIVPPTLTQFPGLTGCEVDAANKTVTGNWLAPTGGIFKEYVLFWKVKTAASSAFNFTTAMAEYKARVDGGGSTDFTTCLGEQYCHKKVTKGTLSSSTPSLNHGQYEFGVQTLFRKDLGGGVAYYRWSQPNTNVKKCDIKIPRATFNEWTRIFAIGPKENHLNSSTEKYTEEALLSTGVPWEVNVSTSVVDSFFQPPGENLTETVTDIPSNTRTIDLSEAFDGLKTTGHFGSSNGIISIAWREFSLDNALDESGSSLWKTEANSVQRILRKYGYKVYRSKDNRITWEDVTPNNLIHAQPYSNYRYRHRPNVQLSPSPSTRMAFFTDYSVINLEKSNEVEQARVYWYKIVPVFNGSQMEVTNPQSAMLKVTLPPPNMALVHRWMANRAQCLELGLTPNPSDNYSCDFTGLGSVPKTAPFTPYQTKIDMKGDLLVDRFELGCNFTRGSETNQTAPQFGTQSDFTAATFSRQGCYKVATNGNSTTNDYFTNQVDNPLPGQIDIFSNLNPAPNSSTATVNSYLLRGDCIGNSSFFQPFSLCSPDQASRSNPYGSGNSRRFSSSGYQNISPFATPQNPGSCINDSITTKFLDFNWIKSNLAQSEFGSVYHNTSTHTYTYSAPIVYSNNGTPAAQQSWRLSASCSINLAAINTGEYLPRWADLNTLNGGYNASVTLDKTPNALVSEASTNKLFDNDKLLAPNIPASIASKKLGLILTTNKAGTPPLMFVSRNTGKKVCNLYQVRQAFKPLDSANSTVSPIGNVQNKRLLRKREFVASTLWPELYNDSHIDYLEGVTASINDGQASGTLAIPANQDKSCVNTQTLNTGSPLTRWSKFPERIRAGHPHLSGAKVNYQCTSRFGIQDLIGNQKEMSSEVLFCDYAPIELLWGKCKGSRDPSGKCNEIDDSTDPHVVLSSSAFYTGTNEPPSQFYILSNGTPKANTNAPSSFSVTNLTSGLKTGVGSTPPQNVETDSTGEWGYQIKLGDNAGYCSLTDGDSKRRDDSGFNWGQDYYSDFFFKTINSGLVPNANLLTSEDSGSPNQFRDGSGYFLDFGDSHMTTPLAYNDAIVFPWRFEGTTASGRSQNARSNITNYPLFSTLLGIPLLCQSSITAQFNNSSCREHSVFVMDSKTHNLATTARQYSSPAYVEFPESEDGENKLSQSSIIDFYTGGSHFKSTGLTGINSSKQVSNTTTPANLNDFYTGVTYEANGSTTIQTGSQADYTNLEVFYIDWSVNRGTRLYFSQGGHFNKTVDGDSQDITYNGRFSTDISPDPNPTLEAGVRCGVMINEVE